MGCIRILLQPRVRLSLFTPSRLHLLTWVAPDRQTNMLRWYSNLRSSWYLRQVPRFAHQEGRVAQSRRSFRRRYLFVAFHRVYFFSLSLEKTNVETWHERPRTSNFSTPIRPNHGSRSIWYWRRSYRPHRRKASRNWRCKLSPVRVAVGCFIHVHYCPRKIRIIVGANCWRSFLIIKVLHRSYCIHQHHPRNENCQGGDLRSRCVCSLSRCAALFSNSSSHPTTAYYPSSPTTMISLLKLTTPCTD